MPKKRITKQQNQGNVGQLQVAEMFLSCGWQPRSLTPDLGEDFIVDIYDNGISAGLAFYVQVKSSEDISGFQIKDGNFSYPIEVKDLQHWQDYKPPVFILLWDSQNRCGHWIMADAVIKKLDKENPKWRSRNKVKVNVPLNNTTQQDDLKRLRYELAKFLLPAILTDKKLEMTLKFSFPNDSKGNLEQEAMRQFLSTGESVSISGQYISGIQLSDWYERKFGKPDIKPDGKIVFGPRRSDRVEKLRLTLLSHQDRIEQVENIEVKAVRVGNEKLTFSNEHSPSPFVCRIIIESTGHFAVTMSLKGAKSSATEALNAYEFFRKVRLGGTLRVEALTNQENWGNWRRIEIPVSEKMFPKLSESFGNILQKMSLIERKTGVSFTLGDEGIGEEDWKEIFHVAEIIESGRLKSRFKSMTWTLSNPVEPDAGNDVIEALCNAHEKGESFSFDAHTKETWVPILGMDVPLGPQRLHVDGFLETRCAKSLAKLRNSKSSPKKLKITIVNGNRIEEYSDWLTTLPELPAVTE